MAPTIETQPATLPCLKMPLLTNDGRQQSRCHRVKSDLLSLAATTTRGHGEVGATGQGRLKAGITAAAGVMEECEAKCGQKLNTPHEGRAHDAGASVVVRGNQAGLKRDSKSHTPSPVFLPGCPCQPPQVPPPRARQPMGSPRRMTAKFELWHPRSLRRQELVRYNTQLSRGPSMRWRAPSPGELVETLRQISKQMRLVTLPRWHQFCTCRAELRILHLSVG
ncbi:hypothetical protein NDU88_000817 [Pleurodeles waltl]|uniref:Uncharacterized protein n=1 Tax=Pleurodeles waltl TaxID=8319 RepID=A0AAV7USY1_PLEWA|nr:hypothetical protein NDU88_000817 [Pleurodeles waltl]